MATFKLDGLKAARRAILALGVSGRRALPSAVRAGAEVLAREVRAREPVDTGFLAAHVRIEPAEGTRPGTVADEVAIARDDFEGRAYYGAAEEFGTSKMEGSGAMRAAADVAGPRAAAEATRRISGAIGGRP